MADEARHGDLIATFVDTSGSTPEQAKFYLESSNWEIGPALETFFDSGNAGEDPGVMQDYEELQGPHQPAPGGLTGLARQAASYVIPGLNAPPGPNPNNLSMFGSQPTRPNKKKKPAPSGSSRIATMAALRGREESDDDSDEGHEPKDDEQQFYVGSGQEVIGPGKKRNPDEIISSVFKSARQHGAEQVEEQPPQHVGRTAVFSGTGMRLDSVASSSSASAPPPAAANPVPSPVVVLRMWRNGFTVNDGPLRLYTDPANQEFMNYVKDGRVPRELILAAKSGDLKVQMEDHRDEEYRPPKQAPTYFGGAGHMLGSPSPAVVSSNTSGLKKVDSVEGKKICEDIAKTTVAPDETQPTTSIQIRLADGSRLVHRFNEASTVADIRRFIRIARPEYQGLQFQMIAGYPAKPLSADEASIKEANLLNAAITVK